MVELSRLVVAGAIVGGVGTALLLSELRWFRRVSLAERLLPFSGNNWSGTNWSGTTGNRVSSSTLSTFRETVAPLTSAIGERVAKLFGVNEDLATRLQRAGMPQDIAGFRLSQFAWSGAALLFALLLIAAIQPALPLVALTILGSPLLGFLVLEQQVMAAAERSQNQLFAELPVLAEQLAMLLSAGFSLNAALNRLAERNDGVGGRGLRTVCERVRHGLTTPQALREWAGVANVVELHRLVAVLALGNETSDLGRLVSEEAKNIRRESQRRLAETIEKRSQQVWVPVTVATLVPGVIFLIIPFLQALRLFAGN